MHSFYFGNSLSVIAALHGLPTAACVYNNDIDLITCVMKRAPASILSQTDVLKAEKTGGV